MNESVQRCIVLAAGEYYPSTASVLPELLNPPESLNPPDLHSPSEPSSPAVQGRNERALVIAADGGFDHARALGLDVNLAIGDFDSIDAPVPPETTAIRLPPQKDDSDTLAALKIGWSRGAREFHVFGALGGRIDHTIANIQLLAMLAQHNGAGYLYGDDTVVTAICDANIELPAVHTGPRRMVSVFSHSDLSYDVNESGLQYALHHATLDNTTVRGLSNELLDATAASIDVHEGTLVIAFPPEVRFPSVTRYRRHDKPLPEPSTHISPALVRRPHSPGPERAAPHDPEPSAGQSQ